MKFYGLDGQQWTNVIAAWSGWLMDGCEMVEFTPPRVFAGVMMLILFIASSGSPWIFMSKVTTPPKPLRFLNAISLSG